MLVLQKYWPMLEVEDNLPYQGTEGSAVKVTPNQMSMC